MTAEIIHSPALLPAHWAFMTVAAMTSALMGGKGRNLNNNWSPAAILPNLSAEKAVEGEIIALAPSHDPRVQAFCASHPKFEELISRFTDAFDVPLAPVVLIVRDDVKSKLSQVEALASFRDLVALCVVPYARSLGLLYPKAPHRISHSNSFWLYPWMLGTNNETLIASTPAIRGLHAVDRFHGQSSPELSTMELKDVDEPLLEALLRLWKRHYLSSRQRWHDRALFRSLNMAAQASQLPAGIDTTLYDIGRMTALWVSAFEILAHPHTRKPTAPVPKLTAVTVFKKPAGPRMGKSGLSTVYPLLEGVCYLNPEVGRRMYAAYMGRAKESRRRRALPCWLYGKLYQAPCDFLHGNPIRASALNPHGSEVSLFWIAPALYRLALTGFLKLSSGKKPASGFHIDPQRIIERAILMVRK